MKGEVIHEGGKLRLDLGSMTKYKRRYISLYHGSIPKGVFILLFLVPSVATDVRMIVKHCDCRSIPSSQYTSNSLQCDLTRCDCLAISGTCSQVFEAQMSHSF